MLSIAKDAEIRRLVTELNNMASAHAETQKQLSKVTDENKLLKRAVSIQDNRQRELMHQNEALMAQNNHLTHENNQREAVLSQAADYVSRLESENKTLLAFIEAKCGKGQNENVFNPYDYHPDLPPPDVF